MSRFSSQMPVKVTWVEAEKGSIQFLMPLCRETSHGLKWSQTNARAHASATSTTQSDVSPGSTQRRPLPWVGLLGAPIQGSTQ